MTLDSSPLTQFFTDAHGYRWGDGLELTLERFKEGSDSFSALVTVLYPQGGSDAPLLISAPRRLNFHADRTITSFAKSLSEQCKRNGIHGVPSVSSDTWTARLEDVSWRSWAQYQEGESRLLSVDEIEVDFTRPPYLVHPLIAADGVTLWYADSSAGKSMIATAIAVAVATGTPILGITPTRIGPVIFYDWEDYEETFRERVGAICAGAGIDIPANLYYRRMDRSVKAGEARIRRECEEYEAVLAIFDSVGEMLGGDPSDPVLVMPAVGVMKRIGCAALALHHINGEQAKSKKLADKQKGYGSVYIRSGARLQWYFDRFQEDEADEGQLYAHNTKVNRGKKSKSLAWDVTYENGAEGHLRALRYASRSAADYLNRLDDDTPIYSLSIPDAALAVLRKMQLKYTLSGLLDRLKRDGKECTEQSLRNALNGLVKAGDVSRIDAEGETFYVASSLLSTRESPF